MAIVSQIHGPNDQIKRCFQEWKSINFPLSLRKLIEAGTLAHLATLNPDGRPQITLIWVGLEGEEIVAAHLTDRRKLQNIRRDPRVTLEMQATTRSSIGLTEYAVLYGEAYITAGSAPELLQQLAHVYLGPEVKFPQMADPPAGFITHIRVEKISGVGPWMSE